MTSPVRAEVTPRRGESPESLVRRFIKKVKKEKIIEEVIKRRFHEKPSDARNKLKQRKKRNT